MSSIRYAVSKHIFASWIFQLLLYTLAQNDCPGNRGGGVNLCDTCPDVDCCLYSMVSEDTLDLRFTVESTGDSDNPWNVKASLRWDPPTGNGNYSYSVDFRPSVSQSDIEDMDGNKSTLNDVVNCQQIPTSTNCLDRFLFETVTHEPTAEFEGLLFGYLYHIRIQSVVNGSFASNHLCETRENVMFEGLSAPLITAPDCFESTKNITYCNMQPKVPIASIPRDLHVEYDLYADPEFALVNVSWKEPISVNGEIKSYNVAITKVVNEVRTLIGELIKVPSDVFFVEIPAGSISLQFTYIIIVYSRVIPPEEFKFTGADIVGNSASITLDTTVTTTTTVEPTDNGSRTPMVTKASSLETSYIIIGGAAVLVCVLSVVFLILLCCYRATKNKPNQTIIPLGTHDVEASQSAMPEFRKYEVGSEGEVILEKESIGRGQFGEVFKARWNQPYQNTLKEITVAVKTTKENLSPALKEQFLDEIRLMIEIGNHPNIMAILGCRTVAEPYYLIIDYMKYGSLKEYLLKSNDVELVLSDQSYDLTEIRQLQISHQISKGMEYLESRKFFHGDLAARNILLGENLEVKISDFGFANNIYETGYARLPEESKRPVKWYSPEATLTGKCSSAGDVWSFGIVLYEIYSRGEEPYIGMLPREVLTRLLAGYRMDKPEDCSQHIYELMLDCWEQEPSARPVFHDIKRTLAGFLANISGDAYIDPLNGDYSDDDDQENV
ncbi:uncharacterized protein [Apostichopus japonicus]|uniref:uncharacterized protein isoform X1 n=1 Tax=Stichopus japonicus TaxID=307972 RepID=UPI003AB38D1D